MHLYKFYLCWISRIFDSKIYIPLDFSEPPCLQTPGNKFWSCQFPTDSGTCTTIGCIQPVVSSQINYQLWIFNRFWHISAINSDLFANFMNFPLYKSSPLCWGCFCFHHFRTGTTFGRFQGFTDQNHQNQPWRSISKSGAGLPTNSAWDWKWDQCTNGSVF